MAAEGVRARPAIASDLRLALLSGAAGWRDRAALPTVPELAVLAAVIGSAVAAITVVLVSAGYEVPGAPIQGSARWGAAALAATAIVVAVLPGLLGSIGWASTWKPPIAVAAASRVGLSLILMGLWVGLLGPTAAIPAWILGVLVGGEITLTAWSLGAHLGGWAWWRLFQLSPIHLGILLTTLVTAVVEDGHEVNVVLVWVTFQVVVLGAAVTASATEHLRRSVERRLADLRREGAEEAHGRLAHWLHDEITSILRLLRFRLQAEAIEPAAVGAELEALEHRLRVRQLEEAMATGSASIAEIVQPYVRLLHDQGVAVPEVPRFDEANRQVDGATGRRIQRALAVLVPNALAAGASTVHLRIRSDDRGTVVEVEDDAGGFDLASVPAGRGLDGLRRELGGAHLTARTVPGGSLVTAVIEAGAAHRAGLPAGGTR